MSFIEKLNRARELVRQQERLSVRALSRELEVHGDELDELIDELVDIQQVARLEGRAIAWTGGPGAAADPAPPATPAHAPPAAREPLAPRDYTPKHLADRILQTKSAVEGERKQVTVLFADVASSMSIAESLGAEDWHDVLDRFFQVLTEGVHRFEGTVNQYTGDGIMALFGAPLAHEDHAQRACFAALHLQGTLRDFTDELRRTRGINLSVRIGINSGDVIVGKIGDDLRMDYTAQGHVVGIAQRMEALAEAGQAYLTDHTARLVSGYFDLRDLGVFEIAGSSGPLRVHALEGVGAHRTRLDISRARGFSKFVGRADEMHQLTRGLDRAGAGEGQVFCVVAGAGVGKSRLCAEFLEECEAQGITANETHCPAHGKSIPLLPILQLLRSFFRIEASDSAAEARRKIAGTLVLLDESFQETLPLVFDFLGVPDEERPAPELDPDSRQEALLEFVRHFVHARSAQEPCFILVDDLHWVDPNSDAFVAQLVDAVRGTRTFLLLNYRPEYSAEWLGRSHVMQLALVPLGSEAISELVTDWLGTDPSVAALPARIRERTGGNPFFTEEVIQSLIESGHVEGVRGAYQLVTPVDRIEVPDRVQSVLAARIDRLAEREKQVLQSAAVIGRKFDAPLLEAVSQLPEQELAPALSALDDAEMIRATSLYPVAEYSFKHPLTHEVALESQLKGPRADRHARVAQALTARHTDKLDENAALLAYHFEAAGESLDAARWHARAAEWIGYRDLAEALRHWESVRTLVGDATDPEVAALGLRAIEKIVAYRAQTGLTREESEDLVTSGRQLATRAGDAAGVARLLETHGCAAVFRGDVEEGQRILDEASSITAANPSDPQNVSSEHAASWAELSRGHLERAITRLEAANRLAGPELNNFANTNIAFGEAMLAWALIETGRLQEAVAHIDRAREAAERHGDSPMGKAVTDMQEVRVLLHSGDPERALRIAGEVVEPAERARNVNMVAVGYMDIAEIQVARQRFVEARAAAELALSTARDAGTMMNLEARILVSLARAKLGCGDTEGALETADESLAAARRRSARHHDAWAHVVRAEIWTATKGVAEADAIEADLRSAAAGLEETGARLIEPDLHLARAELARLRGDEASRERALGEARTVLEWLGAAPRVAQVGSDEA